MDTLVICPQCRKMNRVALPQNSGQPVCGSCKSNLPLHHGVQELTFITLPALLQKTSRPIVIDFWAPWCGPCLGFAPTFQQAAQNFAGKVIFAKLNTEAEQQAGAAFQVRSIPTLIVFKDSKEVERVSGALPLQELTRFLTRFS